MSASHIIFVMSHSSSGDDNSDEDSSTIDEEVQFFARNPAKWDVVATFELDAESHQHWGRDKERQILLECFPTKNVPTGHGGSSFSFARYYFTVPV